MRKENCIKSIFLIVLLLPSLCCADLYYWVDEKGVNINDLRSETIKHSPLKRNGITFRGSTNWYFKPHYIIKKLNGLWYYDNVSATVDIKFTMPKWADYKKANWGEQKRWDAYYKALLDHEKCHKDIAVAAAMKLCRVLVELKSHIGKEELRKIGNFKYWEIYRECKKLNQQFDDETGHGHKTGVILR